MANGSLRLHYEGDDLYQLGSPRSSSERKAVTLVDAMDGRICDPAGNIMRLHANWGHSSARQFKRVRAHSERKTISSAAYVDDVLGQRQVCRGFDTASHLPIAGTPTVSTFNETGQVDLLFSVDECALRAADDYAKYSSVIAARS